MRCILHRRCWSDVEGCDQRRSTIFRSGRLVTGPRRYFFAAPPDGVALSKLLPDCHPSPSMSVTTVINADRNHLIKRGILAKVGPTIEARRAMPILPAPQTACLTEAREAMGDHDALQQPTMPIGTAGSFIQRPFRLHTTASALPELYLPSLRFVRVLSGPSAVP